MHKPQEQVRELHIVVLKQDHSPAEPMIRAPELRARIGIEEPLETAVALLGFKKAWEVLKATMEEIEARVAADPAKYAEPNLVEVIDGLCDTLVVTYGTAEAIGIDIEPFYDEVHRSNMAKAGGERRADGKLLKPPGWTPPDIEGVLRRSEELRLACERLDREPPKSVNDITADEWRALSDAERQAHHGYWHKNGSFYFVCLGCSFPTERGVAVCDACR